MIPKYCEGCNINSRCTMRLYISKSNSKCPCGTCLVKVLCNHDCQDFVIFRKALLDKKLEDVKNNINKTESR